VRIETNRGAVAVPVGAPGAPSREDVVRALEPYQPPVIDDVLPGSPAQRAGVAPGDSIVAIDGRPVRTFGDLVDAVSPAAGRELRLEIARGDETREILVRPESTQVTGSGRRASTVVGRIGATPRAPTRSERLGFTEAAALGWTRTWQMGGLIFTTLRDLGTGDVPLSELGGPGTIAVASAQAAQRGPVELLLLIALLSINVAVLNLLPIPILDGGQILLNIVESAKGSEFSPRTREYILRFGLVAILVLFAIVLFNDTSRLVDFVRGIWN
jgi:regulator of sigma E protease